jgi:ribosomal-protein-alanine N-acetyltransferase
MWACGPDRLIVRPPSPVDIQEIATWRYNGPWRVYDSDGPLPAVGYRAVAGDPDGPLVGFCCAGVEARVPRLRAVVQAWNERSVRFTQALGFVDDHTHSCVQDGKPVEYLVLVRPAPLPPAVRRSP